MRIRVTFPNTQINADFPDRNSTKFKIVISKSLICLYISIRSSSKHLLILGFFETLNAAAKASLNAWLLQADYSRKSVYMQEERKLHKSSPDQTLISGKKSVQAVSEL